MHLPTLLLHLHLLSLPVTLATTLTLTLPSTLPPLSPSTRAQLTTHNHHLTAPLTQSRTFRFTNLTSPGTYNLDIYSRDYDFEGSVVVVKSSTGANNANDVEVYRRSLKNGGRGARMVEAGDKGNKRVEMRVRGIKAYYEERQGFELLGLLKSPMILMALVGLAMVFGMPYLLENMDPEMKAEFEEQQKKSVVGNVAGGGNPLSGFDMAGWMAGQTAGGGATASGREIEEDKGSGQGQGQGKSKGRRRG
ncbi:MAG: hypothetical protein LQ349_006285 [Xanthoria aureola]|nr:MAG: hypothetical protein LQ349_006285 [Xanthoria aureola]